MQFRTRLKPTSSLIDLTPLVDVVLLLLVFFIVTSDILPLKSLNVENPQLSCESPPLTTQVLVLMDAQHVIYLGHRKDIVDMLTVPSALKAEIARVKAEHPGIEPTVVLSVDRRVDYGSFLRLFSMAQECGSHVRLVYKPVGEEIC
jgi:biopolymer transport protein ExbD